jgi:hypothetical protein
MKKQSCAAARRLRATRAAIKLIDDIQRPAIPPMCRHRQTENGMRKQ